MAETQPPTDGPDKKPDKVNLSKTESERLREFHEARSPDWEKEFKRDSRTVVAIVAGFTAALVLFAFLNAIYAPTAQKRNGNMVENTESKFTVELYNQGVAEPVCTLHGCTLLSGEGYAIDTSDRVAATAFLDANGREVSAAGLGVIVREEQQ